MDRDSFWRTRVGFSLWMHAYTTADQWRWEGDVCKSANCTEQNNRDGEGGVVVVVVEEGWVCGADGQVEINSTSSGQDCEARERACSGSFHFSCGVWKG